MNGVMTLYYDKEHDRYLYPYGVDRDPNYYYCYVMLPGNDGEYHTEEAVFIRCEELVKMDIKRVLYSLRR